MNMDRVWDIVNARTNRNNSANMFFAGFMGAIVGAAAGATALFLSDQKNRDLVKTRALELRDKGADRINELRNRADDVQKAAKDVKKAANGAKTNGKTSS